MAGEQTLEEEAIIGRILNVLPATSFEMQTFFSLFRVHLSRDTETACVTCASSPELLLNPDFIAEYCKTDEHLFMLVMHELYHVMLGHTTLFPRSTPVLNIVFDAVINAMLCQEFPGEEYTSFFKGTNPSDSMPGALLRPPGKGTPTAAKPALALLYGKTDCATYHDVYEALAQMLSNELAAGKFILLGSHGGRSSDSDDIMGIKRENEDGSRAEEEAANSKELSKLLADIFRRWPSPDRPIDGCDRGGYWREVDFGKAPVPHGLNAAVRSLMLRVSLRGGLRERRMAGAMEMPVAIDTFLPSWKDRSHEARAAVLGESLLYRSRLRMLRPVRRDNRKAYVYMDVSGSVERLVPEVASAVLPFVRRGLCDMHVFSTIVADVTPRQIKSISFDTTGGTSIDCVLEHVLKLPPAKRPHTVVIITDGHTGTPPEGLRRAYVDTGIRMFVGLLGGRESSYDQRAHLQSLQPYFINLPIN